MKPICMVDLREQYLAHKAEFDNAISAVLSSAEFIKGHHVAEFERELESYLGVNHVITCGNGTDALTLAIWALNLPQGSEIITADYSFIASAEAIARAGFTPILADVNPHTFTILPQSIEKRITPRTKAIIPVHLFGQAAPMDEILQIARTHNLYVIEDNAQSFGAEYHHQKLGTIGTIGCTSFFPSKNLGCFGDGGAIFTNDSSLAKRLRMLANHGSETKYHHQIVGVNSRLDAIQAAILRVKLHHIDEYNSARQSAATEYSTRLQSCQWLQTPSLQENSTHVFHQYTLKFADPIANDLQQFLHEKNIPSARYYPGPLHVQPALQKFPHDNCSNATSLCNRTLSLPMHTELTTDQIAYICNAILSYK